MSSIVKSIITINYYTNNNLIDKDFETYLDLILISTKLVNEFDTNILEMFYRLCPQCYWSHFVSNMHYSCFNKEINNKDLVLQKFQYTSSFFALNQKLYKEDDYNFDLEETIFYRDELFEIEFSNIHDFFAICREFDWVYMAHMTEIDFWSSIDALNNPGNKLLIKDKIKQGRFY